jgi:hypothetical protein
MNTYRKWSYSFTYVTGQLDTIIASPQVKFPFCAHCTGGQTGPRVGQDFEKEKKSSFFRDSNPCSRARSPSR